MAYGAQWVLKVAMKFQTNCNFVAIYMKAIVMKQNIFEPLNLVCKTALMLMMMVVAGCGQGLPATVAVTGEVTYKGAPVEGQMLFLGVVLVRCNWEKLQLVRRMVTAVLR